MLICPPGNSGVTSLHSIFSHDILDVIFIDECHRSLSNTYLKLIELYKDSSLIGLTATPVRGNGEGLGSVYEHMVSAPSIKKLTELGSLVDVTYYSPSVPDLKGIGVIGGDFNSKSLNGQMVAKNEISLDNKWFLSIVRTTDQFW